MQAGSNNDCNNDCNNNSNHSAQEHNPDDQSVPRHDMLPAQSSKQMDLQYFLEMVDLKHRHGSNLRAYHEEWKKCPTTQNFFYWLDYGDGRNVDLEKRPRERLERAQVRYLSREERGKYLVLVDRAGQFRWAKNGELVNTDGKRFRDSLEGVVPVDDPAPRFRGNEKVGTSSDTSSVSSMSSASSASSAEGESQDETGPKDSTGKQVKKKLGAKLPHPAAILHHLVGKPSKKEEWIFVCITPKINHPHKLTPNNPGRRHILQAIHRDQSRRHIPTLLLPPRRPHLRSGDDQNPRRTITQPETIKV